MAGSRGVLVTGGADRTGLHLVEYIFAFGDLPRCPAA